MPRDFALWLYRQKPNTPDWPGLSGEWPQPHWRTDQDLWYYQLRAQYQQPPARSRA